MLTWFKKIFSANRKFQLLSLSLVIVLGATAFLPGISGPFIFDDFPNIVANNELRIQRLSLDELYRAAYSFPAVSQIQRPLAYISFALNGYFAGGFDDSAPFKLTNLFIHIVNSLLIFWMLQIVLKRYARSSPDSPPDTLFTSNTVVLLAAAISLLWFIHPIQITSVLYVVQRMASLSATFVLLGVLSYLVGRERLLLNQKRSHLLIFGGPLIFGTIGILVKESAVLLPVFILSMELTLYANEKPWRNWSHLSQRSRKAILAAVLLVGLLGIAVITYLFISRFLPGYEGRLFSLQERLLTQPRVLFFYISLILLPRTNQFGIHHDDIILSSSLLSPWTTLPSILALATLAALAVYLRKKRPLVSLGILWFLTGHLLESTVFPLEMVHEHRNYLASLGIVIILVQLIYNGSCRIGNKKVLLLLPLLILVFGSLTFIRANQWSSHEKLIAYNAVHHPKSSRAQLELGGMLAQRGYYDQAREAYLAAITYQPNDPSLLIGLQMIRSNQNLMPDPDVDQQIILLINKYPLNATFHRTLGHVTECLQTSCTTLINSMEQWTRTLLQQESGNTRKSHYSYLLATNLVAQNRIQEAINAYRQSFELNRRNINVLLSLTDLYIQLGHPTQAEAILEYVEKNNNYLKKRNKQKIIYLHNKIRKLKSRKH